MPVAQPDAAARRKTSKTFEEGLDTDIQLPPDALQNLFEDAEVEAKYKRLEEIQAKAPPQLEDFVNNDDEDGDVVQAAVNDGDVKTNIGGANLVKGKMGRSKPSVRISVIETQNSVTPSSPITKEGTGSPKSPQIRAKSPSRKGMGLSLKRSRPAIQKWKHLVGQPAELRELRVKSLNHETTFLAVLHPVKVWKVRRKLAIAIKRDWNELKLIFMGDMLKDNDDIPDACYAAKSFNFLRWVDQPSIEAYFIKVAEEKKRVEEEARLISCSKAKVEGMRQRQKRPTIVPDERDSLVGLDDIDEGVTYESDRESENEGRLSNATNKELDGQSANGGVAYGKLGSILESKSAHANTFSPRCMRSTRLAQQEFDLGYELEQINCGQFAQLLKSKGYADKGAFAYLQESEQLTGPGLWIPKKAATRILGLADIYRRQLEIEGKVNTTTELSQITQTLMNTQKYTVDGVNFFATQYELNNWLEAQRKTKASNQQERHRVMSVKKDLSCEALDLIASIEKRLRLAEEKEEGIASYAPMDGQKYCCPKHEKSFDAQVEQAVAREAVDYDNDFLLILAHSNTTKSSHVPAETLTTVITQLFQKHKFPYRQKIVDDLIEQASLDDKATYYDPDILRHAAVNLLKAWKRQLLLLGQVDG